MKFIFLFVLLFLFLNCSSQNTITIYVSPDGNDQNNGTINKPIKTLNALQKIFNSSNNENKVDVFFRKGVYTIVQPLVLSEQNSKASIRLMAYQNENVSFIGGISLPGSSFQPLQDTNMINQIPALAISKIYQADLSSIGITNIGSLTENGFAKTKLPARLELFINNEPQQLPRWPETGYINIDDVHSATYPSLKKGISFIGKGISSQPWIQDTSLWVAGMFSFNWSYDNLKVNKISGSSILVDDDTKYGIYTSSDSSEPLLKAARSIRGFYFYNMPGKLGKPGKWWLDEKNKKIYVYPKDNLANADIKISILEKPLIIISNAKNISIENIEFNCTRADAINIKNSNNILIKDCKIINAGLVGIKAMNVTNTQIIGCMIKNTGAENIILKGGDRKSLTPSGNVIQDCNFSFSSTRYIGHVSNTLIGGVGIRVISNYFHDIPGQGIIFDGNDHIIQNNHFENVCYLLGDMGGVYTGRDPSSTGTIIINNFFENIVNKRSNYVAAVYIDDGSGGMQANNNLFVNCGSTNESGLAAIQVNGGANNQFNNNIFINCARAFSNNIWSDEKWKSVYFRDSSNSHKLTNPDSDIRSEAYTSRYPYLKGFFDSANLNPRINYISNSICYNVKYFMPSKSSYKNINLFSSSISQLNLQQNANKLLQPMEANSWNNWKPVVIQNFWLNDLR